MLGICGVKKSRKIKKAVSKQKYTFIFYNLLAYLIIFSLLGIVAVVSINIIFFREARREVVQYSEYLKSEEVKILGPVTNPRNPRMVISFYDEDFELVSYHGSQIETRIEIKMGVDNVLFELLQLNYAGDKAYFLTNVSEVEFPNEHIKYAKIYMNIDGEVHSRNEIIKVYIICVIAMAILSGVASYILSRQTLKPVVENLKKQLEFVSDASHELRTPLAIVQSKIENILTESDKTVYEVSEDLAISLKEISRLNHLATDLLTLARSDNNIVQLDTTEFDLDKLIYYCLEPFIEVSLLQNKKINYERKSVIINADRNKIYQLFIILLNNALSYTNENDEITIKVTQASSDINIEFSDTGIGISDHTKEHIFERFYREDKARNRATGGNGLGLSIARTIVLQHHGKISVDHNKPKGTKFLILLPRK